MGICQQLYDKPFEYGFMIDYNQKHGKYPLPYSARFLLAEFSDLLNAEIKGAIKEWG